MLLAGEALLVGEASCGKSKNAHFTCCCGGGMHCIESMGATQIRTKVMIR